jgi:DNA-binding CsgD family transcriptional regulator
MVISAHALSGAAILGDGMLGAQQRLNDFVYDVARADDLDAFRHAVCLGLGTVVASDLASYTEIRLGADDAVALTDHPVARMPEITTRLARFAHQHPLITRSSDGAETISDYLTVRRFHALDLYCEVYRLLDAEDQIAINLPRRGDTVVGLAMNRSRRGFGRRDRETLDQLRPVLARAYRRAHARERAISRLAELDQPLDPDVGVIVLDHTLRIDFVSDTARGLVPTYLSGRGGRLGDGVLAWLGSGLERLAVQRAEGRLEICRVSGGTEEPVVLELHHVPAAAPRARLTERQRELMALVAEGASNAEISTRLGISERTVANHLGAVYARLGVGSRTAAMHALGLSHPHPSSTARSASASVTGARQANRSQT